jgi:GntR family transcriptional regulator, transcriptional repressor for pyruvate dehydrogenase complex
MRRPPCRNRSGHNPPMALTDRAIAQIQELIRSGELPPGSRLPPEQELAAQLGLSRNSMREAVKALELIRVLDVRRGDGTFVTSLEPHLLLDGLGFAIELVQDGSVLEVLEVRRMLEPLATGLAAEQIDNAALRELAGHLDEMEAAGDDSERQIKYDAAFHSTIYSATANQTLLSILDGLSSRTLRARIWRGVIEAGATYETLREHQAIYAALVAHDRPLAEASALVHVSTSERWLRGILERR